MADATRDEKPQRGNTPPAAEAHAKTVTFSPTSAPPPAAAFEGEWHEATRYALVAELARGGGGKIAIAIDRKLGRRVALKRALDPSGDERLVREAAVLARLEHPAIVPIHDAGFDTEGAPYYAMKLLDGETLAAAIKAATTFEQRLALVPAVTTVADAIAYAHSQRVIHRDLKPGNVVVGKFGEVAVIDWGLGKVVADRDTPVPMATPLPGAETEHGAVMGTPAYMPPEQAAGDEVDERADVYALGAMLYHVLTGGLPYDAATEETLAALRAGPPIPIDEREPRVPSELAAIAGKAMARAPGDRYPSAKELADDLHRFQTGRLVAAHRYAPWTRAWKVVRRHQVKVALGVAVLAVTAASLTYARYRIDDQTCDDVDASALAAWGPDVRGAAERAFAASGVPYQAAAWHQVAQALDDHAQGIAAMRREACRAGRITHEETDDVTELRMRCLDRRTAELATVAGAFGHADASVVANAGAAIGTLGRVEDCADLDRLRDVAPLPADMARRTAALGIEADLDRLNALVIAGNVRAWMSEAPEVARRAKAIGYAPAEARALARWAEMLIQRNELAQAEPLVDEAIAITERIGDDRMRSQAMVAKIEIADHRERTDNRPAIEQGLALAERVGNPLAKANLLVYRSHLERLRGEGDAALADAEAAAKLLATLGPDDRAKGERMLGEQYAEAGRYDDAERLLLRAESELRALYGTENHPEVGSAVGTQAAIAALRDDYPRAIALEERAIAIDERVDPEASNLITEYANYGSMLDSARHYTDAIAAYDKILPRCEAKLGRNGRRCFNIVYSRANTIEHQGNLEAALAGYRDALARAIAVDPKSSDVALAHGAIGSIFTQREQPQLAIPELEAALALTPDPASAAGIRGDLGRVFLDAHQVGRAISELEAALPGLDEAGEPVNRGMYRTALAQAYWAAGERDKARAIARLARELLAPTGAPGKAARDELDAWEKSRQ